MVKTVRMVLIGFDAQPLSTDISLTARIILVPADFYDAIVLDPNLESALVSSQHARCLFPFHFDEF